jgi:hypothetical protein
MPAVTTTPRAFFIASRSDDRTHLATLLLRAGRRLLAARTSGEVLEAMRLADLALHQVKVIGAAKATHADCLRIILRAEMLMADESGQLLRPESKATNGLIRPSCCTDAAWFHDAADFVAAICFTRGRIKTWIGRLLTLADLLTSLRSSFGGSRRRLGIQLPRLPQRANSRCHT